MQSTRSPDYCPEHSLGVDGASIRVDSNFVTTSCWVTELERSAMSLQKEAWPEATDTTDHCSVFFPTEGYAVPCRVLLDDQA